MSRTYKARIFLAVRFYEDEHECQCEVHYEYSPGTPESGRFSGPPENYDPGSPDEVTITRMFSVEPGSMHDALPQWMFKAASSEQGFLNSLAMEAREQDIGAMDTHLEAQAEERRDEARRERS